MESAVARDGNLATASVVAEVMLDLPLKWQLGGAIDFSATHSG
jgi:hypothetical protein